MRFLVLIGVCLCLAGLALGQGPDTSKPITYTTAAVPLHRAFEDIGKSAGIKFEIDGSMGEEPVILRLQGVPVKDVMDRVAAMEGAEWKLVDRGFLLFRSSDD